MDGFCWLGELDLTLFYTIEGYFDNLKSLMTENDRDRKWGCVISLWRTLFYVIYCIILEVS